MTSLFPDIVLSANKELLQVPHSLFQHWGAAVDAWSAMLGPIFSMSPCPGFGREKVHFLAVTMRVAEPGAMHVCPGLLFCTTHIITRIQGYGWKKNGHDAEPQPFCSFFRGSKVANRAGGVAWMGRGVIGELQAVWAEQSISEGLSIIV